MSARVARVFATAPGGTERWGKRIHVTRVKHDDRNHKTGRGLGQLESFQKIAELEISGRFVSALAEDRGAGSTSFVLPAQPVLAKMFEFPRDLNATRKAFQGLPFVSLEDA
jgi:hypothetical protein